MSEVIQKDTLRLMHEYKANVKWFSTNYKSIKEKFKGKSIAVYNNQILDSDESMEYLLKRLESAYQKEINGIFIHYVPKDKYSLTA